MKTQINQLINGSKNIIRNEEDPKYLTAKRATSHVGYAGSNRDYRNEIAARVYAENGDTLNIVVRGISLTLNISRSLSGKSWTWSCELTEDQYKALGGWHTDGTLKKYELAIYQDCEVCLYSFTRKSEAAQWRQSWMEYLDESFVEIL